MLSEKNGDTNVGLISLNCVCVCVCLCMSVFSLTARKQEIIKITEQLIEAINNGDFEAYAYVTLCFLANTTHFGSKHTL